MTDPVVGVLIVLGCIGLSAFFSGSETALLRLRIQEIDEEAKDASGPAILAIRNLLRSTSRLLVTILLGNNVVNIFAATFASALAVNWFGPQKGIVISTVVMTVLVLVFAEILPKALAAHHPSRLAHAVALPLYLIHQALRPVHIFFDRIVEPIVHWLAGDGDPDAASNSEEVLRLARQARLTGPSGSPLPIIAGAAHAENMTVSDVMVPRAEIIAYSIDMAPGALLQAMLDESYTRVPIYEDSVDTCLGVMHLRDIVQLVNDGGTDLRATLKPVLRVPERKPILDLLAEMQRAFAHLAIVKDEFGVTMGLVTVEDVLEEIVGEIRDEFDRDELLTLRRRPDGSYRALARMKVLDFNRETRSRVPAERGDTLAGVVYNQLGRSPKKGDVAHFPGYAITVSALEGSQVTELEVRRIAKTAPPPEGEA